MKIFEGKSPTERNKIIAASVLGLMALIALTYTFGGMFFGGKKPTVTVSTSPTPKPSGSPNNVTNVSMPTQDEINLNYTSVPVYYAGTPSAPDAGRNIFAFYEPPPPTPYSPTPFPTERPVVQPTLIQTPAPPLTIFTASAANGATIYAGQQGFRLEVSGDKFTPDSQIIVNNQAFPTTFISPQQLSADIPTDFIRSAGNLMITVATPDGKLYSNAVSFGIQAPPLPQFKYIGVTIRKGNNNNTATISEEPKKESLVRLNDLVANRFKVVSIGKNEIVVQDVLLGFSYRKSLEMIGQATTSRGDTQTNPNNPNNPNNPTINPNNPNCIPGIPCNIQLYNPNNSSPTVDQRQQQKQQQQKDDYDDDGDN